MGKNIWMRAGITLNVTEEEVTKLLNPHDEENDVLKKILSEGRFEFDGDSYIPSICVELYNKENGTSYEEDDYEFNLLPFKIKPIMKTYKQIHFNKICQILTTAAQGVSAVCGYDYVVSDMVYSLNEVSKVIRDTDVPYYIAIREQGTECGNKARCIERCKVLGYPLVIAKIEKEKVCDYNMTITYTHNWRDGDNRSIEREFNL